MRSQCEPAPEIRLCRRDDEADHHRVWEEPRRRSDETHRVSVDTHPGLLIDLATHALLKRLAKLEEARERRVPTCRPCRLTPKQTSRKKSKNNHYFLTCAMWEKWGRHIWEKGALGFVCSYSDS